MCEFKNGDVVEYAMPDLAMRTVDKWAKAEYVGVNPHDRSYHVLQNAGGVFITRLLSQIRKPKVKREGWINLWKTGGISHRCGGDIFDTELSAKNYITRVGNSSTCVATVRIEWYE